MTQVTIQVNGMSCQHCVNSIEKAIKELGAKGSVDLNSNSVTVDYDESKITLDKVKETIEEQGYDVV